MNIKTHELLYLLIIVANQEMHVVVVGVELGVEMLMVYFVWW